jgi:hypothetical protein
VTTILNDAQRALLLANGRALTANPELDPAPVVKLFLPDGNAVWLLSELHADGIAFGLCDLGLGSPELGYVHFSALEALRGRDGRPLECDTAFIPSKPLSAYAWAARLAGRIVA